MKTRLKNILEKLRASFWFLPAFMLLGALGLSVLTIYLDRTLLAGYEPAMAWVYQNDAEGSRQVLSTIAGSMITVAGVVFSITIAALVQASSQFGPRLLNNFIRDRGNQLVLGTFTATFLYCLLILRTINSEEGESFVPHYSVFMGVLMAVMSIAVFIFFIHHMASSIHASFVISLVGEDLDEGIDRLIPNQPASEEEGTDKPEAVLPENFEKDSIEIRSTKTGYLQAIDSDGLKSLVKDKELVLEITVKPGDFVSRESQIAQVMPSDRADEKLIQRVNGNFLLGRNRTAEQDIRFQINQLAEVAVRALSPGINDPFTAITCVDWLGTALGKLVERPTPQARFLDEDDNLNLIVPVVSFAEALDAAFAQIRHYGRENRVVTERLVKTISDIAKRATREGDLDDLRKALDSIEEQAKTYIQDEHDRERIARLCQEARELF